MVRVANVTKLTKARKRYIRSQGGGYEKGQGECDQEGTHISGFWDAGRILFTLLSDSYKSVLL